MVKEDKKVGGTIKPGSIIVFLFSMTMIVLLFMRGQLILAYCMLTIAVLTACIVLDKYYDELLPSMLKHIKSKAFANPDKYKNTEELFVAYGKHNLETLHAVVAVDYTESNMSKGKRTFRRQSLHKLGTSTGNPYEQVIAKISETLPMLQKKPVSFFIFGDSTTGSTDAVQLPKENAPVEGFLGVLEMYRAYTPNLVMDGPTNFAPVIRKTIEIASKGKCHHVLIIITDGKVDILKDTEAALIEASHYPISIIVFGVGDGPFSTMEDFDDKLEERKFDNLQFVDWNKYAVDGELVNNEFVLDALQELPAQMKAIRKLGLLG